MFSIYFDENLYETSTIVLKRKVPEVLKNFLVQPQFLNFKTEIQIVQRVHSLRFKLCFSSHENAIWLDSHFVCQIVTFKNVVFSYREIQEKLTIKSKSTVSNAYLRYKKVLHP